MKCAAMMVRRPWRSDNVLLIPERPEANCTKARRGNSQPKAANVEKSLDHWQEQRSCLWVSLKCTGQFCYHTCRTPGKCQAWFTKTSFHIARNKVKSQFSRGTLTLEWKLSFQQGENCLLGVSLGLSIFSVLQCRLSPARGRKASLAKENAYSSTRTKMSFVLMPPEPEKSIF